MPRPDRGRSTSPGLARSSLAPVSTRGTDFLAWLTLAAMSLFVWINVFTGMFAIPVLDRIFTGEEGTLTRHMDGLLNRTVVLASLMIAWCLCDVVMEAVYAMRRYYG